jgi:hypothetical protein
MLSRPNCQLAYSCNRAAWKAYWIAKRAQRGAITADIPDVLDLEIPTCPQE